MYNFTWSRSRGAKKDGGGWTNAEIEAVWQKRGVIPAYPAYGTDACGAMIERSCYGNTDGQYGWEIDHIKAVSQGGTDDLWNLQPLHWENNRAKGDGPLVCVRK